MTTVGRKEVSTYPCGSLDLKSSLLGVAVCEVSEEQSQLEPVWVSKSVRPPLRRRD